MKNTNSPEINDEYFDFVDYIEIIKSEAGNTKYEELYYQLLQPLYYDANVKFNPTKNDHNDVRRKKKGFSKISEFSTKDKLPSLIDDYKNSQLIGYIVQPKNLIAKLLFAIKIDKIFFSDDDFNELVEHRDDLAYILAFITIRTVNVTNQSIHLRHSDGFSITDGYESFIINKTMSVENDAFLKIADELCSFQLSHENLLKDTEYKSELLSTGARIYDNLNINKSSSLVNLRIQADNEVPNTTFELPHYYESSDNHLLIVGEGGIGKTTFLYSIMKNYQNNKDQHQAIPIYIKLSNCKASRGEEFPILEELLHSIHVAIKGNQNISIRDITESFERENDSPDFSLLLDGFNEIDPGDFGQCRTIISDEINRLIEMPNVRIILTTRQIELYSLSVDSFSYIEAKGINKEDLLSYLSNYLDKSNMYAIENNTALMETLQIPLFLLMFSHCFKSTKIIPETRGAILYTYFNSRISAYTEKINTKDKAERKVALVTYIILDFILPQVGFYMEETDSFSIDTEQFENIIGQIVDTDSNITISKYIKAAPPYLDNTSLSRAFRLVKDTDYEDIIVIIRDFLGIISQDAENKIYFNHQYIRDYFAALYCIQGMYIPYKTGQRTFELYEDNYIKYEQWTNERIALINEIHSIFFLDKSLLVKDYFASLISMCEVDKDDFNREDGSGYALLNIIPTFANLYGYDLSSYDFENLNLSGSKLSNINFFDPKHNRHSSFKNSFLWDTTFAPDEHTKPVVKWKLLDDNLNIISISSDCEVKLWSLSSQKCVLTETLSHSPITSYDIHDLDFITRKDDAFILISFMGADYTIDECATYNITTKQYTQYIPYFSDEDRAYDSCDYLYWGYESESDRLVSITKDGYLCYFSVDDNLSFETISLNDQFAKRISTNYISVDIRRNNMTGDTKKFIILPDNKLLYLEADIWGKYFHGYDDNIYEGNDNFHTKISIDSKFTINNIEYLTVHIDGYDDNELESNNTRHINIFIYDITASTYYPLTLEGDNDGQIEILTSLVVPGNKDTDVLNKYITISKDKKIITLHNVNDIFTYTIGDNRYEFQKRMRLPNGFNCYIKHCDANNDILTLYNQNTVIKVNPALESNNILLKKHIFRSIANTRSELTNRYVIEDYSHYGNGSLKITNIYSDHEASLAMSITDTVVKYTYDLGNIYILYQNGTIATFDAHTLSFVECYNYCPNKHVISADYNYSTHEFVIISSPFHYFLHSTEVTINVASIMNHKNVSKTIHSSTISHVRMSLDGKYILLATDNGLLFLDSKSLNILDTSYPKGVHTYEAPIAVIAKETGFSIIYSDTFNPEYNSQGVIFEYRIADNCPKLEQTVYIPVFTLKKNTPGLYIRQFEKASICYIRFKKKSSKKINYTIVFPDEENTTEHIEQSLNEWSLAFIESDLEKKVNIFEAPRKADTLIYVKNLVDIEMYSDSDIIMEIYDQIKNESMDLYTYSNLFNLVYDNIKSPYVYRINHTNACVEMIDTETNSIHASTPKIQPTILTQGCDFTNCNGADDFIPRYL